jgi:hypothetical protein
MLVAKRVLIKLLTEFRDNTCALNGARPIPPAIDIIAFAVLALVKEYHHQLTHHDEIHDLLDRCNASIVADNPPMPRDYRQADMLPFTLTRAIIEQDHLVLSGDNGEFAPLTHPKSDLRWHIYNVLWFAKGAIDREAILPGLFKNLADTLGYVEEAAGLARSLFDSDEEFYLAAEEATPPNTYPGQFSDRIAKLKQGHTLLQMQQIFMPLELKVKDKIAKTALSLETPDRPTAVQLELPVG